MYLIELSGSCLQKSTLRTLLTSSDQLWPEKNRVLVLSKVIHNKYDISSSNPWIPLRVIMFTISSNFDLCWPQTIFDIYHIRIGSLYSPRGIYIVCINCNQGALSELSCLQTCWLHRPLTSTNFCRVLVHQFASTFQARNSTKLYIWLSHLQDLQTLTYVDCILWQVQVTFWIWMFTSRHTHTHVMTSA